MTETCYSKGIKIILSVDQNVRGKWTCQFAIPRLIASGMRILYQCPSGEHPTETQARTAGFASAKLMLRGMHPVDDRQALASSMVVDR
jgi:hypothetical protein